MPGEPPVYVPSVTEYCAAPFLHGDGAADVCGFDDVAIDARDPTGIEEREVAQSAVPTNDLHIRLTRLHRAVDLVAGDGILGDRGVEVQFNFLKLRGIGSRNVYRRLRGLIGTPRACENGGRVVVVDGSRFGAEREAGS